MNRIFPAAILAALALAACESRPNTFEFTPSEVEAEPVQPAETPEAFTVTDYMNKDSGGTMPEWVGRWLESGFRGVEAMDEYEDRYVFIARNEGTNFRGVTLWRDGFSPELDFPRLAAARIEARAGAGISYPDITYGAFFAGLIRAASDTPWRWTVKEEDFWLKLQSASETDAPLTETWTFLVLVTIEKTRFASQLNSIFQNIELTPPPSPEQAAATSRLKERFFEGF